MDSHAKDVIAGRQNRRIIEQGEWSLDLWTTARIIQPGGTLDLVLNLSPKSGYVHEKVKGKLKVELAKEAREMVRSVDHKVEFQPTDEGKQLSP
jgi:hypothetical protein